jgi:HEAT repeat protein
MLLRLRPAASAIFLLLLTSLSAAQAPTTQPHQLTPSDLQFQLISIGPGREIYEWFGHNAIIVTDTRTGQSDAYNYGVFEFDEGFLGRFIEGRMMYTQEAYDGQKLIKSYINSDRSVWLQELNLTDRQKIRLWDILHQQNKQKYLYNYYNANCSTKVRDALDYALDGQLKPQLVKIDTGTTYRWHSQRIAAFSFPIYTSILFILGHNVDKPINAWEESFLPLRFMLYLKNVQVSEGNSPPVAVVAPEQLIYRSTQRPERSQPPRWWPIFLGIGIFYGALLLFLTRSSILDRRSSKPARWIFALFSFAWSLLAAFAGCFLAYAFTTTHWSVYWNENILQMTPLSVPLVLLAPIAIFGRRRPIRLALFFSAAALLTSVLGFIFQVLPGFYQVNGPIIALCLPIHLGLALSMYILFRRMPAPAAASTSAPPGKRKIHGAAMKVLFSLILLTLLTGCAGPGGVKPATRREEPPIPPPPPRVNVALSESLRQTARDQINTSLTADDPVIRTHAIEAARDALASGARDQIFKGLIDKEGIVRYASAVATGELRLEGAQPTLIKMINDPDPGAQIGAIFALHRLGNTRYSSGLETALKSPDPFVRATAAFVLGRLGEKSAITILRLALKDRAVEVRLQSAEALWRLGDEEGLKVLVGASLSGHPAHAMVALLALAGPNDTRVKEHIRAGLESDYLEVKLVAARALGLLGSDEAFVLARDTTHSPDVRQRYLAALALGAIARPDSQEILAPLLKDADPDVRVAAAAAILELRP